MHWTSSWYIHKWLRYQYFQQQKYYTRIIINDLMDVNVSFHFENGVKEDNP